MRPDENKASTKQTQYVLSFVCLHPGLVRADYTDRFLRETAPGAFGHANCLSLATRYESVTSAAVALAAGVARYGQVRNFAIEKVTTEIVQTVSEKVEELA